MLGQCHASSDIPTLRIQDGEQAMCSNQGYTTARRHLGSGSFVVGYWCWLALWILSSATGHHFSLQTYIHTYIILLPLLWGLLGNSGLLCVCMYVCMHVCMLCYASAAVRLCSGLSFLSLSCHDFVGGLCFGDGGMLAWLHVVRLDGWPVHVCVQSRPWLTVCFVWTFCLFIPRDGE